MMTTLHRRRWGQLVAAFVPIIVGVGALIYRHIGRTTGEEIARRAQRYELTHPNGQPQQVHVHFSPARGDAAESTITFDQPLINSVVPQGAIEMPTGLALRLAANDVNWRTPLNTANFAAWRERLPDRQDVIFTAGQPPETRTLRTITALSDIREREITVDPDTWIMLRHLVVFADGSRIEWSRSAPPQQRARASPSGAEHQPTDASPACFVIAQACVLLGCPIPVDISRETGVTAIDPLPTPPDFVRSFDARWKSSGWLIERASHYSQRGPRAAEAADAREPEKAITTREFWQKTALDATRERVRDLERQLQAAEHSGSTDSIYRPGPRRPHRTASA